MAISQSITDTDGVIHVNYTGVTDVSEALAAATGAIKELLTELESSLANLRNTWDGQTRDQYDQKKAAWDGACDDMSEVLKTGVNTLDDMAHNYSHTDMSLAFQWSELH